MSIFADRSVRAQAVLAAALVLVLLLLGQLAVLLMTQDYKAAMLRHDQALAGYLSRTGYDKTRIAELFTADKTVADTSTGAALLNAAGYDAQTQTGLLPEVQGFRQRHAPTVFLGSAAFSAAALTVFYRFARHRDRRLQAAEGALRRFLDGDTAVRISDAGEGSSSRLFSAVNQMATSLTAHIQRETKSRAFLKDTISDISHQLKTPLAALSMYNEIIGEEETGNEVVERFTEKSRREITRMEELISSLLKLARLDAGAIRLEPEPHNLGDFLEECRSRFLTRADREEKRLTLLSGEEIAFDFDEIWLSEAVGNLIKNALDHTSPGDTVALSCRESGAAVELTVRDNGAGIAPEDIHHIFKRFYRSRLSQDRQGIGIGLSLCKAIVEQHGGTVTVESSPGAGAAFHLIFPKLTDL